MYLQPGGYLGPHVQQRSRWRLGGWQALLPGGAFPDAEACTAGSYPQNITPILCASGEMGMLSVVTAQLAGEKVPAITLQHPLGLSELLSGSHIFDCKLRPDCQLRMEHAAATPNTRWNRSRMAELAAFRQVCCVPSTSRAASICTWARSRPQAPLCAHLPQPCSVA